jgi:hypothetical protein
MLAAKRAYGLLTAKALTEEEKAVGRPACATHLAFAVRQLDAAIGEKKVVTVVPVSQEDGDIIALAYHCPGRNGQCRTTPRFVLREVEA